MLRKVAISLLLLICTNQLFSEITTKDLDSLEQKGKMILSYISNDDFVETKKVIESLKENYSTYSIDTSYEAAMYYKIIEEYRSREYEKKFHLFINTGIDNLEKIIEKTTNPILKSYFLQYLGALYGYRGMYRTLKGEWGSAFLDGRRGYNTLVTSLDLNNKLIDNYAGIGIFLYWRSRKASFVKYLLFWGDRREEGLKLLNKAIDEGNLIKSWALGGLLRIQIEEEKFEEALKTADKMLEQYPNDVGVLRRKAEIFKVLKKDADALLIYQNLLLLFKTKDFNTSNAQIEAMYEILKLKNKLKIDIDSSLYEKDFNQLKKTVTKSFLQIDDYIADINKMISQKG